MDSVKRKERIENNLGLVHSCAHRFRGRGIEYEDLYGAGCVGLIKAASGFDESRGWRFSTYAVPVILGEIKRLFRDGGAVKVSRSLKELSMKTVRNREIYMNKYGREPTISELAQMMDVTPEQVAEAMSASLPPISLTVSEDDGGGQIDIPVNAPEEKIADILSLKQAINTLEVKDRKLIILRYINNKTQTETAKLLGMTQVQVSRREKKILMQLREGLTG
ncbi:MAG: sigma-70 family RNA polymerase sigma factor [Clostridiales bacterium]|nr:sigma-70 family RNA polymerase sigma factor [Clostridiales bacterium]